MGKIVAIGGGDIGRFGYDIETTGIDREIIKLTGKKNPSFLFIPTASGDSETYIKAVDDYFNKKLGCNVSSLCLIKEKLSFREIEKSILSSDIIYVGGGNTLKMMTIWRKLCVDKILMEAYNAGIVMSGLSAGSICWFKFGSSDSRKPINPEAGFIKVKGLNFINAMHCPHYDVEINRRPHLKGLMKKMAEVAIAVDNCCALQIVDDKYRIITSKDSANAYKVYWKKDNFYEEILEKSISFKPLSSLLEK